MEDLGDILFYVLAAAIAIIGAIINKKKKKAERTVPQPGMPDVEEETSYQGTERIKASTQYEMIDEDSLQTGASAYEGTMMKPSVEQTFKMGAEYEGEYSEPMADDFALEGSSAIDLNILQDERGTEGKISLPEENSRARKLIDDFDLSKAIVYSEILRRKDFV